MRAMLPPPRSRAALVVAVLLAVVAAASAQVYPTDIYWAADEDDGYGVACTGTVGECASVARRELGGGGNIGYGALGRGNTPCSQRGASYYTDNCRPGAPANPYSRGCEAIAKCRG